MNKYDVFICHSSKDKKRFTDNFVVKLKKHGINPWYDKYEIHNGDSIIEKVNNGLEKTTKGIIVFSNNILKSKFVSTEINSLIYEFIYNYDYQIIPIIIDENATIPKLINYLSPIIIKDINKYDNELNDICDVVFGKKELLNIGKPPSYSELEQLPNCTKQDTDIFKRIGDYCLEHYFDEELDYVLLDIGKDYVKENYENKINDEKFIEDITVDALNILEENHYIKDCGANVGLPFTSKEFTSKGFAYYFKNFVKNNDEICKKVISAIYNQPC